MYIKKKVVVPSLTLNKPKSLHNLISIIQNSVSTPRKSLFISNQFFDILNKVITIQLKLFETNAKEDNLTTIPKYKKYLEGKISSFLQSICPVEQSMLGKVAKKTSASCCLNRSNTVDQDIAMEFRKLSMHRVALEKAINKSNSREQPIGLGMELTPSNRHKAVISSYFNKTPNEDNKGNTRTQSKSSLKENSFNKRVKYKEYSISSPNDTKPAFYFPTHFNYGSNKSKSIMKTFSQINMKCKKTSVTFNEHSFANMKK